MTVKIVHKPNIPEPRPRMFKVTCRNSKCQCTLHFEQNDILKQYDYGEREYECYIVCPNCNRRVDTSLAEEFSKSDYANLDKESK